MKNVTMQVDMFRKCREPLTELAKQTSAKRGATPTLPATSFVTVKGTEGEGGREGGRGASGRRGHDRLLPVSLIDALLLLLLLLLCTTTNSQSRYLTLGGADPDTAITYLVYTANDTLCGSHS